MSDVIIGLAVICWGLVFIVSLSVLLADFIELWWVPRAEWKKIMKVVSDAPFTSP